MRQTEIRTVTQALTRSNEAIAGALLHGATLEITRNTAALMTVERAALNHARDVHEARKLDLAEKRRVRNLKLRLAMAFTRIARDMLRPHLGNQYQAAWTAAGFIGTLIIPKTAGRLVVLLETLTAYLEANPAVENASLNITAGYVQTLAAELLVAENAVKAEVVAVKNLLKVCKVKFAALKKRLGDLFKECSQVMSPLDNRWLAFGFKIPGAEATPDQPQRVVATFVGSEAAGVQWDRSARAKYYRVFKKVVGMDVDYVHVGNSTDLHMLLDGLPSNAEVEIVIAASNSGGESVWSTALVVRTL